MSNKSGNRISKRAQLGTVGKDPVKSKQWTSTSITTCLAYTATKWKAPLGVSSECGGGPKPEPVSRLRDTSLRHSNGQDSQGTVTSATVCVLPGKWATRERPEPLGDMARYTDLS